MKIKLIPSQKPFAFTFIELVIVVAVIGIMSALAISGLSNGANDARSIVARQQQATLQSAVNAWVSGRIGKGDSVKETMDSYNAKKTNLERLTLVGDYLDQVTYDHLTSNSVVNGEVTSQAMKKLGWGVVLEDWASNSYPKVNLNKGN